MNGQRVPLGSLNLFCEGAELHYRTPHDFGFSLFRLSRASLQRAASRRLGHPLALPERGIVSLGVSATTLALADRIQAVLARASSRRGREIPAKQASAWRELLLDAYVPALEEGLRAARSEMRRTLDRRLRMMRRIHAYWSAHRRSALDLAALARATGTSSRVLQYAFRELYGLSPRAWFEAMRLNEVHRELEQRDSSGLTVAEIATDWGFTHLGRFAQKYQALFSEKPSETLRQSPSETTRRARQTSRPHPATGRPPISPPT